MAVADPFKVREGAGATVHGETAARPERAPIVKLRQIGRLPLNRVKLGLAGLVHAWNRLQKRQRVGVLGIMVNVLRRSRFYDLAGVHDVDPVRIPGDDP